MPPLPEGAVARLGRGMIEAVQYSPDGSRLAVGGSVGIWLHDAHTGETVSLLTVHGHDVSSVFSPDGRTLASGSNDGTVLLWAVTGDQSEPKAHGNEQASTKDGEQAQSPLPPATEILEDTFGQWPDCLSGAYRLMRAGDRITLTVTATRRPNPVWHPYTPVQKLFVLPPALRPPFALVRESAVEVLPTGRSHWAGADGDVPAAWSRLQIAPDGSVRYSAVPPSRIRWITPEPAELPAAFHLHAHSGVPRRRPTAVSFWIFWRKPGWGSMV